MNISVFKFYSRESFLQVVDNKRIIFKQLVFFFYLGFVPRTFTKHRTAREGRGHSINSPLPLPPASQTLDISWVITAGS